MKYRIEIEIDSRLELSLAVFWKNLRKALIKSFGWALDAYIIRRYEAIEERNGTTSWIEMESL